MVNQIFITKDSSNERVQWAVTLIDSKIDLPVDLEQNDVEMRRDRKRKKERRTTKVEEMEELFTRCTGCVRVEEQKITSNSFPAWSPSSLIAPLIEFTNSQPDCVADFLEMNRSHLWSVDVGNMVYALICVHLQERLLDNSLRTNLALLFVFVLMLVQIP